VWDGCRWKADAIGMVDQFAVESVRVRYADLIDIKDKGHQKKALGAIRSSETRHRIAAALYLAQSEPEIAITADCLDVDPHLLCCGSGVVDLPTGQLYPHDPKARISLWTPFCYDPSAKAERWEEFVKDTFEGNEELIDCMQRLGGYCLTGCTHEKAAFFLVGPTNTGKSTLVEAVKAVMGDYAAVMAMTTLIESHETNTYDLAQQIKTRLVVASEFTGSRRLNEDLFKRLTGDANEIRVRPIRCRPLDYTPEFKLMIDTNEMPKIRSQDPAMKNRVRIIPFEHIHYHPDTGKEPVADLGLRNKLLAEGGAILGWLIQGAVMWYRDGLRMPSVVRDAVEAEFRSQDPLGEFLEDCHVFGLEHWLQSSEVWDCYDRWCSRTNNEPVFRDVRTFSKYLLHHDLGIVARRDAPGHRGRWLQGVGFSETELARRAAQAAVVRNLGGQN